MALTEKLTAIANAIRAKTGKTAKMTMAEMVTEIGNIGGNVADEDGLVTRSIAQYENDRVKSVGTYAFYECGRLTSVSFQNATSIYNYSFTNCFELTSVSAPKVNKLGAYALSSTGLQYASFPLATNIGEGTFFNCTKLTALVLGNTSQVCSLSNTNAFNSTPIKSGTGYIYVPDDLVDSYKAATNWSTYAAQIKPLSEYTGG